MTDHREAANNLPVTKDIAHRPLYSLDTISTLCQGCEDYWPCELAGHTGFYWDRGQGDAEDDGWMWVCHDSCPHQAHGGSESEARS